jgi:hypothetical protein
MSAPENIRQLVREEVRRALIEDPEVRRAVQTALRETPESHFDKLLEELRLARKEDSRRWAEHQAEEAKRWEEQSKLWAEQNRRWAERQAAEAKRWEEQKLRWDEQVKLWAEQNRRWEEHQAEEAKRWEEQKLRWDEQSKLWAEQNRRWAERQEEDSKRWVEDAKRWEEENLRWKEDQKAIRAMLKRLDEFDSRLGALGARWGLHSEEAFRSALQGILEESFGVQVINLREWDDSGAVFGRPDQVELDVIIYNSILILCEIKSAVSKADVALFERKVQWYEQRHGRKADRRIVISPLTDSRAERFARALGIEVYSFARDVRLTPSGDQ